MTVVTEVFPVIGSCDIGELEREDVADISEVVEDPDVELVSAVPTSK